MAKNSPALEIFSFVSPFFTVIIGNLNFYRIGYPIIIVGTINDNPAVGAGFVSEFKAEDKILIFAPGPYHFIHGGGQFPVFMVPGIAVIGSLTVVLAKQRPPFTLRKCDF